MSIPFIPYLKGFNEIHPPIEVFSKIVGAYEEAYVDVSSYVPKEAKRAVILAALDPSAIIAANLLNVNHSIYDNLVDYNVYGSVSLLKLAGEPADNIVCMPWCQYFVPLSPDRRYAYDISGDFNGNTVFIRHWLIGYLF